MDKIESIAERIRVSFEKRTQARDRALAQTRTLIRHCSHAIRAIHRDEQDTASENIKQAKELVSLLQTELSLFGDLYHAGYTQDALKEFAEASILYSLVLFDQLPDPESLNVGEATYLQGLAEVAGELRRRCLDNLRHGNTHEAEKLLDYMDEIYAILITMDYPDAITGGLRRLTDIVRGVTERTRGDLTISLRQYQLEQRLSELEQHLVNPA
ncbi:MAG: haloacid dehalogenase [Chloroflexi bacterium RBG_16_54_18]|nr:MAG: haloacid dehalogenase [Chloroflexi bacterium RBG_16_54_18]